MNLGFALIAVGVIVDVAYHVVWNGDGRYAGLGLLGHVITLLGMVVTMVGVAVTGLRSAARPSVRGESHAAGRGPSAA
ncbi:MAG TPA: hypothetical protein VGO87_11500 [Acidimicrobiia bacterium]